MPSFINERDGQIDFYNRFIPVVDSSLRVDDILADNNDGVLNGNLLEFKIRVSDLNAHLFQCIKYLSALRIKGHRIPATILILDCNGETAYMYKSADYLDDIEKVYTGAASKGNTGFLGKPCTEQIDYSKAVGQKRIIDLLREKHFTKIHIDENCIVGWASEFYKIVPTARKEDFLGDNTGQHRTIGEIRNPSVFKDYIHAYEGESNVKFQYLMDKLNDTLQKKNLGAFYTPEAYAKKSHELLRQAISRVPDGNDYIILDRCAGTGNLEKGLTDEELLHCVLSTVEYYEYKVLQEILGSKVRLIIPPVESSDTFNAGLVRGADALSKEYVENPLIMQYVNNPKCTIILFENPPYAETTSAEHQRKGQGKKSSAWKNSYVVTEMKKTLKGSVTNDLGNAFIWSGFKYYLRQDTDSYIVYSPVKYWKAQHLIDKRFMGGYAFNRKWFHTKIDACIMAAYWSNEDETIDCFQIEGFDYDATTGELSGIGMLDVKRIHSTVSAIYYDKRAIPARDRVGILCGLNGLEQVGGVKRNKPARNSEILGYMVTHSSGFDNPDLDSSLLVGGRYDGNGFYLRKDNYLEKMPLFCMSRYIKYNRDWTNRARIMKSADGAKSFYADVASGKLDQWLRKCLLFTCLEMQNHMRTFKGSDGHFYRNELCLDTTNGDTAASRDISKLVLNDVEKTLLQQWNVLMNAVKATPEYDSSLTYGVYQIYAEIDTSFKDDNGCTVWNNIAVHSALTTLNALLKNYYNQEIVPMLFEYEFLK